MESTQPLADWCVEIYAKAMTVDQRDELMTFVCEWLRDHEIAVAADASDVSALVAARPMRDGEIERTVGDDAYRAQAVPKRNGKHFFATRDE